MVGDPVGSRSSNVVQAEPEGSVSVPQQERKAQEETRSQRVSKIRLGKEISVVFGWPRAVTGVFVDMPDGKPSLFLG